MFTNLNEDIIRNLAYYLDLFSVLNLSTVDKSTYQYLDELFYKSYAIYIFGNFFWIKASKRPIIKSKPLKTYKAELIRIETFQNVLDGLNYNRWTQKDFYNYWIYD
tara:strand:+ start:2644 stop:2961 length:318 start_codon:yes stop_codon:yes gene_type:complete